MYWIWNRGGTMLHLCMFPLKWTWKRYNRNNYSVCSCLCLHSQQSTIPIFRCFIRAAFVVLSAICCLYLKACSTGLKSGECYGYLRTLHFFVFRALGLVCSMFWVNIPLWITSVLQHLTESHEKTKQKLYHYTLQNLLDYFSSSKYCTDPVPLVPMHAYAIKLALPYLTDDAACFDHKRSLSFSILFSCHHSASSLICIKNTGPELDWLFKISLS